MSVADRLSLKMNSWPRSEANGFIYKLYYYSANLIDGYHQYSPGFEDVMCSITPNMF